MRRLLVKTGIFVWFIATNVISAAAIEAAIHFHRYRFGYISLAIGLFALYAGGWYYRIKGDPRRGATESVIRYYWRTRLSKGAF